MREVDAEQGAAVLSIVDFDLGTMPHDNFLHDRQAEAAAGLVVAGDAMKAFEYPFSLVKWYAGSVVLHLQPGAAVVD
jgi:hypothetical protein